MIVLRSVSGGCFLRFLAGFFGLANILASQVRGQGGMFGERPARADHTPENAARFSHGRRDDRGIIRFPAAP